MWEPPWTPTGDIQAFSPLKEKRLQTLPSILWETKHMPSLPSGIFCFPAHFHVEYFVTSFSLHPSMPFYSLVTLVDTCIFNIHSTCVLGKYWVQTLSSRPAGLYILCYMFMARTCICIDLKKKHLTKGNGQLIIHYKWGEKVWKKLKLKGPNVAKWTHSLSISEGLQCAREGGTQRWMPRRSLSPGKGETSNVQSHTQWDDSTQPWVPRRKLGGHMGGESGTAAGYCRMPEKGTVALTFEHNTGAATLCWWHEN